MVREDLGDKQASSTDSTMSESGVPTVAAGTDSTMSESGVPTGPASTEQQPGQDLQAGPAQQAGESETVENVRALMQQLAAAATESAAPAVQPRRILTRTAIAYSE